MSSLRLVLYLTILIPLLLIRSSSSSVDHDVDGITSTTKLVDSICKQTSNYTFCVESIYTDPRAPKAHDYFLLAYISFGQAYLNATDTLSYIKHYYLLPTTTTAAAAPTSTSTSTLQRCSEDYEKAVSALEEAYNDLNSETYFDLKVLANSASQDALHCSQSLINFNKKRGKGKGKGKIIMNSLTKKNANLRGLCEICVVVSNQLT